MVTRKIEPSETDINLARKSKDALSDYLDNRQARDVDLDIDGQKIVLPASAVNLLVDILDVMASGKTVTLIPEYHELTTVEAATILNVSRPFLIGLLEKGDIPYRMVGTHRRIRMEDVLSYKQAIDAEREAILDQLVEDAQNDNMGYDV